MVFQSDQQKRQLIAAARAEKDAVKKLQHLGALVKMSPPDDGDVYLLFRQMSEIDTSEAVRNFAAKCAQAMKPSESAQAAASAGTPAPAAPPPAPAAATAAAPPATAAAPAATSAPAEAPPPAADSPPPPPTDERMKKLVNLLQHKSADYRVKAVQAAMQVGLAEALPHLAYALKKEESSTVLEQLLPAVAAFDAEKSHFNDYLSYLRSSDPLIKVGAIKALDCYDDDRKYRLLIPLASDRDSKVKSAAITALGRLSRERLVTELTSLGTVGNHTMKEQVLTFLGDLKWEEVAPVLMQMCADPDFKLRKKAIGMMAKKGLKQFLDLVIGWIKSAGKKDLQVLLDNLDVFDKKTKGKYKTDIQILRTRLDRIIDGDERAREVDLVLSIMHASDQDTSVAATAKAGGGGDKAAGAAMDRALDEMLAHGAQKAQKSKSPAPQRKERSGGRGLDDEGLLKKLSFIQRFVNVLKMVLVAGLMVAGYIYFIEPIWMSYMHGARNSKLDRDFHIIAETIKRYEVSGKKFVGLSSDALIEANLLQSCADPYGEPYLIDPFYRSIVCKGVDKTYPETAAYHLREDASLLPRDDIRQYFGLERPPSIWVGVDTPRQPSLFEMSIDGAAIFNITSDVPTILYKPALSPDGSRMVWINQQDGGSDVMIGDMFGGGGVQVSAEGSVNSEPSWASDSRHVIYSSKGSGANDREKVTVSTLSGKRKTFFKHMPDDDNHPKFFPGSTKFAFCRRLAGGNGRIKYFSKKWNGPRDPNDTSVPGDYPTPMGKGLLFLGREGNDTFGGIYQLIGASKTPKAITDEDEIVPPYVIAQGKAILLYVCRHNGGYLLKAKSLKKAIKKRANFREVNIFWSPYQISAITWRGIHRLKKLPTKGSRPGAGGGGGDSGAGDGGDGGGDDDDDGGDDDIEL